MQLITSRQTNLLFSKFLDNPPNAIILSGPKGSGKEAILEDFSNKIKNKYKNSTIYKIELQIDKKHILIDQIKNVKSLIKTKNDSYRIIFIPNADLMTSDAQNSILKILEEPPKNVIFLLSSSLPHMLLPTVRSRAINIKYTKPSIKEVKGNILIKDIDEKLIEKYYSISRGRMGLFASLLGDNNNEMLLDIEEAKEILGESLSDRLLRVDSISKDFNHSIKLIDAIILICESMLEISVQKNQHKVWLKRLEESSKSYDLIFKNVSTKLVLNKLFYVL